MKASIFTPHIAGRLCIMLAVAACLLTAQLCLTACHDDDDDTAPRKEKLRKKLTIIDSINGVGDNGYNDIITNTEIYFSFLSDDVWTSFLTTSDLVSTEQRYSLLTTLYNDGDSVLIVLNSSDHRDLARSNDSLSLFDKRTGCTASDLRVLLFEDNVEDLPNLVYSFYIERYGAYYLAGRLLGKTPALVVAAMKGDSQLDSAMQGFIDGYKVENPDGPIVEYIADDASGFANPDRAVAICDSVMKTFPEEQLASTNTSYDGGLCILPLAGGSSVSMYGYTHSKNRSGLNIYIIGVDTDYNLGSASVPFSLMLPLGEILYNYLESWRLGSEWPKYRTYGLDSDDPIRILLSDYSFPLFLKRLHPESQDASPCRDDVIKEELHKLEKEAIEKEKAYMEKRRQQEPVNR